MLVGARVESLPVLREVPMDSLIGAATAASPELERDYSHWLSRGLSRGLPWRRVVREACSLGPRPTPRFPLDSINQIRSVAVEDRCRTNRSVPAQARCPRMAKDDLEPPVIATARAATDPTRRPRATPHRTGVIQSCCQDSESLENGTCVTSGGRYGMLPTRSCPHDRQLPAGPAVAVERLVADTPDVAG